jgi:hypothetical protein
MTDANNSKKISSRLPKAFVAIPCGDFYSVQAESIRSIMGQARVQLYVAEDDPSCSESPEDTGSRLTHSAKRA